MTIPDQRSAIDMALDHSRNERLRRVAWETSSIAATGGRCHSPRAGLSAPLIDTCFNNIPYPKKKRESAMKYSLFACAFMGAIVFASLPAFAGQFSAGDGKEVADLPGLTVTPYDDPNAQPHFYTPLQNGQFWTYSQEEYLNHEAQQDAFVVNRDRNQTALSEDAQAEQIHVLEERNSIYLIALPIEGSLDAANQACISLTGKRCPALTKRE
jgi:hypothetical protein